MVVVVAALTSVLLSASLVAALFLCAIRSKHQTRPHEAPGHGNHHLHKQQAVYPSIASGRLSAQQPYVVSEGRSGDVNGINGSCREHNGVPVVPVAQLDNPANATRSPIHGLDGRISGPLPQLKDVHASRLSEDANSIVISTISDIGDRTETMSGDEAVACPHNHHLFPRPQDNPSTAPVKHTPIESHHSISSRSPSAHLMRLREASNSLSTLFSDGPHSPHADALRQMVVRQQSNDSTASGMLMTSQSLLLQSEGPLSDLGVDDVVLGDVIGSGGYGKVLEGTAAGIKVAVKIITHSPTMSHQEVEAAEKEAQLSASLSHPNAVATHTAYSVKCTIPDGTRTHVVYQTHIVMEFCNYGTLRSALDACLFHAPDRRAILPHVLAAACHVAAAVAYMHRHGMVHRDLKSSNVLISRTPGEAPGAPAHLSVKVADFGLSKLVGMDGRSTTNSKLGTITHVPPEIIQGARVGKSTDVYAFGVILWELCTGLKPYHNMKPFDIIFHKMNHPTTDYLRLPTDLPPDLAQLCRQCWDSVAARPAMDQVLLRLQRLRASLRPEDDLRSLAPSNFIIQDPPPETSAGQQPRSPRLITRTTSSHHSHPDHPPSPLARNPSSHPTPFASLRSLLHSPSHTPSQASLTPNTATTWSASITPQNTPPTLPYPLAPITPYPSTALPAPSNDPRSQTPALPYLEATTPTPTCSSNPPPSLPDTNAGSKASRSESRVTT